MKNEKTEKRIGIMGGSFDPIHMGHINIAQSACQEYHLDEVWFIPAGHSPNKDESEMTPAEERAEMVSLALKDYPKFQLSRIEIDAKETSYTYLTLTKLKNQFPSVEFFFIMGADSLDYFDKWRYPEIICQKAVILVAVRDDMDSTQIEKKIAYMKTLFPAYIYPIKGGRTDISSTELRRYIRSGAGDLNMLPEAVLEYIRIHRLYEG